MGNKTKVGQVFQELCWQLGQILNMSPEDVSASSLFVTLIPPNERRRIWEELRQSGVALPELRLANPVLFLTALTILLPVTVWAILSKNGLAFLCLLELFWIAGKLTRPWAIFPPIGCETVQEAVLANTPFHQKDYHAGLWPPEDIAAKVRWIFSERLGIPFRDITDDTKIANLCC